MRASRASVDPRSSGEVTRQHASAKSRGEVVVEEIMIIGGSEWFQGSLPFPALTFELNGTQYLLRDSWARRHFVPKLREPGPEPLNRRQLQRGRTHDSTREERLAFAQGD